MASENEPTKKRKPPKVNREQREDRLSSLPDTILIEILSLISLNSAATTEVLSTRWRGIWTHITSIHIHNKKFYTINHFLPSFHEIMRRRTPSFIHSFNVDFGINFRGDMSMNLWLRKVCDRNPRHIKLQLPRSSSFLPSFYDVPSFIFQTSSLVSIDLESPSGYRFLDIGDDPSNLPNLEKLRLRLAYSNDYKWLEKLIEDCSSLKELSLELGEYPAFVHPISINCSSESLRWLSINLSITRYNKVTINAPKLEYLSIRAHISNTIRLLGEVPNRVLHSANVEFLEANCRPQSNYTRDCISKLYGSISNIRFLTINFTLNLVRSLFCNVTRLTLILKYADFPNNFNTVLSSLVNFPKLNVLILKLVHLDFSDDREWTTLSDAYIPALRQVKRIDIDVSLGLNRCISDIVEYLVRGATVLERFNFIIGEGKHFRNKDVRGNPQSEIREHNFCRLLYNCPRASKECEVLFNGKYLLMSKNTLPNVLKANGDVFPLY